MISRCLGDIAECREVDLLPNIHIAAGMNGMATMNPFGYSATAQDHAASGMADSFDENVR